MPTMVWLNTHLPVILSLISLGLAFGVGAATLFHHDKLVATLKNLDGVIKSLQGGQAEQQAHVVDLKEQVSHAVGQVKEQNMLLTSMVDYNKDTALKTAARDVKTAERDAATDARDMATDARDLALGVRDALTDKKT